MVNNEKFELMLSIRKDQAEKTDKGIELLKEKIKGFEEGSLGYENCAQRIRDKESRLRKFNDVIEFMRPNDEADIESRSKILKEFSRIVDEFIPDGFPIVFHGTNNIGTVREILKTGGLLIPEERGVSMESYATQIDVTYKSNIQVTCEFADAGIDSFLPYGAIFAFKPRQDELENVISTGDSAEVFGGVSGVSFREEPKRLYAIITTPENIERVKEWCKEYSIDENKVCTHNGFINKIKMLNTALEM